MEADNLYEVIFAWMPESDEDLKLEVGDVVEVLEMKDGWWMGRLVGSEPPLQGYFPSNYVREKMANAPKPPPRPTSAKVVSESIDAINSDLSKMGMSAASSVFSFQHDRGMAFSIESLDAFDDLMNNGFAVEFSSEKPAPADLPRLAVGAAVEVDLVALNWDGAANEAHVFSSGKLVFHVGGGEVCRGLDAAMSHLPSSWSAPAGQEARVICAPSMAYGDAGNPPLIPPNSSIVFLISSIVEVGADAAVSGPKELLVGGSRVPTARRASKVPSTKRKSVVLVRDDIEGK